VLKKGMLLSAYSTQKYKSKNIYRVVVWPRNVIPVKNSLNKTGNVHLK